MLRLQRGPFLRHLLVLGEHRAFGIDRHGVEAAQESLQQTVCKDLVEFVLDKKRYVVNDALGDSQSGED